MNKKLKIKLNIILPLVFIVSLTWGYVARDINCWFEFETMCSNEGMGWWPIVTVFIFIVPLGATAALIVINNKK